MLTVTSAHGVGTFMAEAEVKPFMLGQRSCGAAGSTDKLASTIAGAGEPGGGTGRGDASAVNHRAGMDGPGWTGRDGRARMDGPGRTGQDGRARTDGPGRTGQDGRARMDGPGWTGQDGRARMDGPGWTGQDGRARTEIRTNDPPAPIPPHPYAGALPPMKGTTVLSVIAPADAGIYPGPERRQGRSLWHPRSGGSARRPRGPRTGRRAGSEKEGRSEGRPPGDRADHPGPGDHRLGQVPDRRERRRRWDRIGRTGRAAARIGGQNHRSHFAGTPRGRRV